MNSFLDRLKKILSNEKIAKVTKVIVNNKKYLCVCGLFILMLLILYFFTGEDAIARRIERMNNKTVSGEDYVPDKEFEVNAYPEINTLISSYFTAYRNADFATLETLATPISEKEKSYIYTMSQYYESYNNINCYTKHGLSKNSYIVTVCLDLKFYDQEVMAPSMVNFYVQTNVDGSLYINNLYSDFNMKYKEKEVNKDIYTAFRKYLTQDDYLEIYNEIENSFNTLIKENNEIFQLVKRTIPLVRQEWEDAVFYVEETVTENTEGTEVITPETTTPETATPETATPETTVPETTAPETQEPTPEPEPEPIVIKVKTLEDGVNVRLTAGVTEDNWIAQVEAGTVFVKLGEENGWVKIQYNADTIGYIKANYVEEVTE